MKMAKRRNGVINGNGSVKSGVSINGEAGVKEISAAAAKMA
jgi:hypothetical protein